MKKLVFTGVLIVTFLISSGVMALNNTGHYLLRISFDDSASFKSALKEFNMVRHYDIAGIDRDHLTIDIVATESEYRTLAGEYALDIIIRPGEPAERLDPLFTDEAELVPIMQQYHADYPAITKLITIGQTEEGRDIYAIKISDNAETDEDEPVVLYNGQHHAREVMCVEVCLDTIDQLLTGYGSDPTVTDWVNNLEIWVVPIVNMDGVAYVYDSYDMWRKDRHPNGGGSYGIDPNRNYPAFWNTCGGSSGDPDSDTYRGENPGDSACSAHMMTLSSQIMPWIDLSYHSYSELVLYPYGCDGSYPPEFDVIENIGQTMAGLIERDDGSMGYTPGTPWGLLYSVDGGDIDWHYAENGTIPFVIELNSSAQGFQPAYNPWRDSTVTRIRPAWKYLLDRCSGPMITGHVTDACSGSPITGAEYALQEYPLTADETTRTTNGFGRYFKFVTPGEYHVEVSAPGYTSMSIPVTVGNSRVDRDIPLVPTGSFGLYVVNHAIHDESGDNDGVIDPGETVGLEVVLQAVGNTTGVSADLSTTDPYVTVDTGHAVFGNIADGATGSSHSPHFVITVDAMCPTEHNVTFNLSIAADQTLCADSGVIDEKVSNYVYECPIYEELLDTDPGYTIDNSGSGGWAYGHPTSGPGGGYTGANCYGTNLSGDYGNNGNFNLTSTAYDCSAISETTLTFRQWLQNESGYDTAYVQVSTDNINWTTVWSGYAMDTSWTEKSLDISDIADGQPQVYIRWKLTSDTGVVEMGFYVDDISICGYTLPPDVPRLQHDSHVIDDSAGNGNGEINAGESIVMPVTLINTGTAATGISGTISTTNPHVTITTANADWPDIGPNATGTSLTGFAFTVSPDASDGENIVFTIDWFTNEFSGQAGFTETVVAPTLEFASSRIIDAAGDGDGILDPGETAQMAVSLVNSGTGAAQNVSATLSSNHPEYISIDDGESDFPDIPSGASEESLSPHFTITADGATPDHTIITFTLDITADGYTSAESFDREITTSNFARRFTWPMNTDPGWTGQGQWAFGVPQGSGGDPSAGYTGDNVYGYNLAGAYSNGMSETYLTSTAIDCSNLQFVEVRFMRWLGVESSSYDHASFRVSNDGNTWTTIWDHSGTSFTDPDWQAMSYDISAVADGQPTVYLRWVMGTTDSSVTYCGWNIDDVEIWAESTAPTPTPTPDCLHTGDVNFDGEVTSGDAQQCFMIALGSITPTPQEECAADCNGDGEVTSGDAQGVFAMALGSGSCADGLPLE